MALMLLTWASAQHYHHHHYCCCRYYLACIRSTNNSAYFLFSRQMLTSLLLLLPFYPRNQRKTKTTTNSLDFLEPRPIRVCDSSGRLCVLPASLVCSGPPFGQSVSLSVTSKLNTRTYKQDYNYKRKNIDLPPPPMDQRRVKWSITMAPVSWMEPTGNFVWAEVLVGSRWPLFCGELE